MQTVTPFLWFDNNAAEAVKLYSGIIPDFKIISSGPMSATFSIGGQEYIAFNGGAYQKFNESFSLMIQCDTQDEIDTTWEKLTANGGEESRCGWLKDKFGLSWQVVPRILNNLLINPDREKADRAMQAMLKMNKLNISELQAAFDGDR